MQEGIEMRLGFRPETRPGKGGGVQSASFAVDRRALELVDCADQCGRRLLTEQPASRPGRLQSADGCAPSPRPDRNNRLSRRLRLDARDAEVLMGGEDEG